MFEEWAGYLFSGGFIKPGPMTNGFLFHRKQKNICFLIANYIRDDDNNNNNDNNSANKVTVQKDLQYY
jgi:hypothetical protein